MDVGSVETSPAVTLKAGGLFPRFSDGEYQRRYTAVRELVEQKGLSGVLLFGTSSGSRQGQAPVHYLTSFMGHQETYLFVPVEGEPVLWVQYQNHLPNAQRVSVLPDTRWGGEDSALSAARELQSRLPAGTRLGLVGPLPVSRYNAIMQVVSGLEMVDISREFTRLRLVKSAEEIEWMRRAARYTDMAADALAAQIRPGLSEYELGRIVQASYLPDGGLTHFHYISSTPMDSPDRCVPAQDLSARVLQPGDVVLTEISAGYWGYSGQILRPYTVAAEPNEEYRRMYEVALHAYERIVSVLRDGATVEDVLDAAQVIDEAGYTICDDLVHGYGGGYLPPVLRTRQTGSADAPPFTLRENMTVVVQPNVVDAGWTRGVQVGNLLRITRDGVEPLQQFPMQLTVAG